MLRDKDHNYVMAILNSNNYSHLQHIVPSYVTMFSFAAAD